MAESWPLRDGTFKVVLNSNNAYWYENQAEVFKFLIHADMYSIKKVICKSIVKIYEEDGTFYCYNRDSAEEWRLSAQQLKMVLEILATKDIMAFDEYMDSEFSPEPLSQV